MATVHRELESKKMNGKTGSPEGNNSGLVSPYGEPLFSGGISTAFNGKTKAYTVETYRSGSEHGFTRKTGEHIYQEIPEHSGLVATIGNLYREVYPGRFRRNPELTLERVSKSLSNPRTILELVRYQGVPIGYGIFPRLLIGIDEEPVLYSSRAFTTEHEGEGLGTHVLERAIRLHKAEGARARRPLRYGMLMTQNWYSLVTLEKLKEKGLIEKIQPFDEPLNKRLLYGVHSLVFISSSAIEETGLSRGELVEVGPNETVAAPRYDTRAYVFYEKMTQRPPRGSGVNTNAGDVQYVGMVYPEILPLAA